MVVDGVYVESCVEIADATGLTVSAIKSRVKTLKIEPYYRKNRRTYYNEEQITMLSSKRGTCSKIYREMPIKYQLEIIDLFKGINNNSSPKIASILGIPVQTVDRAIDQFLKNGYVVMESKMNHLI